MKFRIFMFFLVALSYQAHSADWGSGFGKIERIWYYGNSVIVSFTANAYAGSAECLDDQKFSFKYSDFSSEEERNRLHSFLLMAYASKAEFRPLYHSTECGPENRKKFIGRFELK